MKKPYNSLNDWLIKKFGERVYKISLNAGLTCPNRDGTLGSEGCIYCNLKSSKPATIPNCPKMSLRAQAKQSIKKQLNDGIEYVQRRHGVQKFIAYFQSGTNTYGPLEKLTLAWKEAISDTRIVGLAISTRPDCLSKSSIEALALLSKEKFLWVELGLQTSNDKTLKIIKRGDVAASFTSSVEALAKHDIPVCAHVILGLPKETKEDFINTATFLNGHDLWGVKIHNLHVLRDTPLEEEYKKGNIHIPTLNEYAIWTRDFIEHLSPKIIIHRFNSHSPRDITIAPEWSINKLAILNAVENELKSANSWQGKSLTKENF